MRSEIQQKTPLKIHPGYYQSWKVQVHEYLEQPKLKLKSRDVHSQPTGLGQCQDTEQGSCQDLAALSQHPSSASGGPGAPSLVPYNSPPRSSPTWPFSITPLFRFIRGPPWGRTQPSGSTDLQQGLWLEFRRSEKLEGKIISLCSPISKEAGPFLSLYVTNRKNQ